MGIYYYVFAEARVKDKWVGFNPYIRGLNGEIKMVPLYGWEQSWFRDAYDELSSSATTCGLPSDMSEEMIKYFKPDEMIEFGSKQITRREFYRNQVFCVNYGKSVANRLVKDCPHQYSGYVDKIILAAYKIGDVDEIVEWLDEQQYKELSEKEKHRWSYYEWDDDSSWYFAYSKIANHIESMIYWFAKNADSYENGYSWDDVCLTTDSIRLIVEMD